MENYLIFNNEKDKILFFIDHFKRFDNCGILEKTFSQGHCYYFAVILKERFNGVILYDKENGHFVTKIDNNIYDITGDITKFYKNKKLLNKEELENLPNYKEILCGMINKYVI